MTNTFQYTFSAVLAGAFVFIEVRMPKKFRPDKKKISYRNLIHFMSKPEPKYKFYELKSDFQHSKFAENLDFAGGEQNLQDFAHI